MVSTAGLVFSRHPEFISGSYQFEVLRPTCKMLKRVQHDGFVFNCRRGNVSWICSTLGKFRFRHFVPVCSISSLSGLTSCRPSANPLNPQKVIPVQPLNYKAD